MKNTPEVPSAGQRILVVEDHEIKERSTRGQLDALIGTWLDDPSPRALAVASRQLTGVAIDPYSWLHDVNRWNKVP